MNLDHDFFQVSKKKGLHQKRKSCFPNSSEDQKRKTKMEEFFFPILSKDQKKKRSSPQIEELFLRIQVKIKKLHQTSSSAQM